MDLQYEWGNRNTALIKRLENEDLYVRVHEKYGDSIHLITNEDDLVQTMLHYLVEWDNRKWIYQEDWYFVGTYQDYFKQEIGMSIVDYDKLMNDYRGVKVEAFTTLREAAATVSQRFAVEREGYRVALFYKDILKNGLGKRAGLLYNQLIQHTWDGQQMFSLECFDSI